MKKRNISCAIILIAIIILSLLSACGTNEGTSEAGESKDGIVEISSIDTLSQQKGDNLKYTVRFVDVEQPLSIFNWTIKSKNGVYMYGYSVDTSNAGNYNWYLREVDFTGRTIHDYDLAWLNDGENINAISSPLGQLWIHSYGENDATGKEYNKIWVYNEAEPTLVLEDPIDENEFIVQIVVTNSTIVINSSNGLQNHLYVYDHSGKLIFQKNLSLRSQIVLNGEQLFIVQGEDKFSVIFELNTISGELVEVCKLDSGTPRMAEGDYLFISTPTSYYKFSFTEKTALHLFNWASLGLDAGSIIPLEETDKFFYSSYAGNEPVIAIIEKGAGIERKPIILAINNPNGTSLSSEIIRFNKTSNDYVIEIKNYADYQNGQEILATEMISGNGPDIILLSDFSSNIINAKNLEDLMPFFEKDPELNLNHVLTGPLEAMKTDGALLDFIPLFQMETIVYDPTIASTYDGTGFASFCNSVDAPYEVFRGYITRDEFLRLAFCNSNHEERTADELVAILSVAKQLPVTLTYDDVTNRATREFSLVCNENHEIFVGYGAAYGDDISVLGIPFWKDNTGMIVPYLGIDLGMSKSSVNKDGVWAFFKHLTSNNVFDGDLFSLIPLNLNKYQYKQLEKEKAETTRDESETSNVRADFFESTPKETRESFYEELFRKPCGILRTNSSEYHIVEMVADQFFSGNKSAEDVAKDILSRLALYYAEQG